MYKCAETAVAKTVEAMLEENERKENVLVNQVQDLVDKLDDKMILKMTARQEKMCAITWRGGTTMDGQIQSSETWLVG